MSESAYKLSPHADHVYANHVPQVTYIEDIWKIGFASYRASVKDVSWDVAPMTDGNTEFILSPVPYGRRFAIGAYDRPLGEFPEYDILTYNPRTDEPPNPLEVPFFTDEQGVWELWDNKRRPLTEGLHYGMKRDPIGNLYYPGFPAFQPEFVSDFDILAFDPERDPKPKWQETGYFMDGDTLVQTYLMLGADGKFQTETGSRLFTRYGAFCVPGDPRESRFFPPGNVLHLNEYYVCICNLVRGEDYAVK
jgi:hypothetical protein